MPIFAYECKRCGEEFELLIGVGADSKAPKCESCGSKRLQKLLSAFATPGSSKGSGSSCSDCSKGSCSGCSHH